MLLKAARARETGQLPGPGLARQACGDPGLALRLVETSTLTLDDRGSAQAVTWGGDALVVGYDDSRVSVWRPTETKHRDVDTGHVAPVLDLCFLSSGSLATAGGDGQVRLHSLARKASRAFHLHGDAVNAVLPQENGGFLSGSSDGTVLHTDPRLPPSVASTPVADQTLERVGRSRRSVPVYALASDASRPWMLAVGGGSAAVRVYDQRFCRQPTTAGARSAWVAAYVPSHLKPTLLAPARAPAYAVTTAHAHGTVAALSFARGGREIAAAYAHEAVYAFDCAAHARDAASLMSVEDFALPRRLPRRRRSAARVDQNSSQTVPESRASPDGEPSSMPRIDSVGAQMSAERDRTALHRGPALGISPQASTRSGAGAAAELASPTDWWQHPHTSGTHHRGAVAGSHEEAVAQQRRSRRLRGHATAPVPAPQSLVGQLVGGNNQGEASSPAQPPASGAASPRAAGASSVVWSGGGAGRPRVAVPGSTPSLPERSETAAGTEVASRAPPVQTASWVPRAPGQEEAPSWAGRLLVSQRGAGTGLEESTAAAGVAHASAPRRPAADVSSRPRRVEAREDAGEHAPALSGRGPSLVGTHEPAAPSARGEAPAVQVGESRGAAASGAREAVGTNEGSQDPPRARPGEALLSPSGRTSDSRLGAIIHRVDGGGQDERPEISTRSMFARAYDLIGNGGMPEGLGMQAFNLSSVCLLGQSDAELLVCPSSLGAALVWDYETGQLLNVLVDPTESPMLAAASRPGTMDLATTSRDAAVRVWSPQAMEPRSVPALANILATRVAHAAEAVVADEGLATTEAGEEAQSLLLHALGLTHRNGELQGRDGRSIRCNLM